MAAPVVALVLLVGFALAMVTPRTWRAPRPPRVQRLPAAELIRRREEAAAVRAAEVAPRPHHLGWRVAREGGVLAAYGPAGERDVYSAAMCGWVRS